MSKRSDYLAPETFSLIASTMVGITTLGTMVMLMMTVLVGSATAVFNSGSISAQVMRAFFG